MGAATSNSSSSTPTYYSAGCCLSAAAAADLKEQREAAAVERRRAARRAADEAVLAAIPTTPPLGLHYTVGDKIGEGSFGSVFAAADRGASRAPVAIKRLDLALGRARASSIVREYRVLEHLFCGPERPPRGLVAYVRAFHSSSCEVAFVFERMRGGELFHLLVTRGALPEAVARRSLRQVAEALAFVHERGVVHRDIKPENLLLKDPAPLSLTDETLLDIRLSDFGLAQLLATDGNTRLVKTCGTWAYAAPEMTSEQRPGYSFSFDMWAFGVCLFIVLSAAHPFDELGVLSIAEIKERARRADFNFSQPPWERVSAEAKDLVARLIVVEPAARLTAARVLEHSWWCAPPAAMPTFSSVLSVRPLMK